MSFTITLPDSVWDDALNPLATEMQGELGLPIPAYRKVGKGGQRIYSDVSEEVARALADHLADRSEMMLFNCEDPQERSVMYRMRDAAQKIRDQIS